MQKYNFTGDRDHDQFVYKSDMSEFHWDILMSCSHQGSCDDDCDNALKYFNIEDIGKARNYLDEIGIEDVNEKDDHEIGMYYLWLLSADIQELEETEEVIHD